MIKLHSSGHFFSLAGMIAAGTAFFAWCAPVVAAPVVVAGSVTTVGSGGIAPGTSANYKFFGDDPGAENAGTQPTNLTSFTETFFPQFEFGASSSFGSYSSLQAPGGSTAFTTGLGEEVVSGNSITANIATFQLNAGVNQAFSLYVLFGNTDGNEVADQSIGVSANGGTTVTTSVTDTIATNDFLRFDVSGANAGDTFTIVATSAATDHFGDNSKVQPYAGGVTFGALVPEPSTGCSLAFAVAGLLGWRRRRS
jgi:hypothetical protein